MGRALFLRRTLERHRRGSAEAWVAKHGRAYSGAPFERARWQVAGCRSRNGCYRNAWRLAIQNSGLTYVEGFAVCAAVAVVSHAWCVEVSTGGVVDSSPAWGSGDTDYLGVELDLGWVGQQAQNAGGFEGVFTGGLDMFLCERWRTGSTFGESELDELRAAVRYRGRRYRKLYGAQPERWPPIPLKRLAHVRCEMEELRRELVTKERQA